MFSRLADREARNAVAPRSGLPAGNAEEISPTAKIAQVTRIAPTASTTPEGILPPGPAGVVDGRPPASLSGATPAGNFASGLSLGPPQPIMDVAYPATGTPEGQASPPTVDSSAWTDDPLSVADKQRFLQRVAQAFAANGRRDGLIRLKIHPPELGSLRVHIRLKDGRLIGRLEAEKPEVCSLLAEGLEGLRQRLESYHIRVEKLEVALTGSDAGWPGPESRGQAARIQPPDHWPGAGSRPRPEAPPQPESGPRGILDANRVDIRV